MNRKELIDHDEFGGYSYTKEELTAASLSGITGFQTETITNSTAYIQGWLKALKEDKKLLVSEACQAQKAARRKWNCDFSIK